METLKRGNDKMGFLLIMREQSIRARKRKIRSKTWSLRNIECIEKYNSLSGSLENDRKQVGVSTIRVPKPIIELLG